MLILNQFDMELIFQKGNRPVKLTALISNSLIKLTALLLIIIIFLGLNVLTFTN